MSGFVVVGGGGAVASHVIGRGHSWGEVGRERGRLGGMRGSVELRVGTRLTTVGMRGEGGRAGGMEDK